MATTEAVSSARDIFAALNAGAAAGTTTRASTSEEVQNRFLKLLVTQLQNQDPLNPLDNAAVTTQISQINTVTGIERLNATLDNLLATFADGQAMQAANLIGKNVLVAGSALRLHDGAAHGGVRLEGAADKVTLSIVDAAGRVVQSQNLGAHQAGLVSFVWDGKTDAGTAVPDGKYSFAVSALRGNEKVNAEALQVGTVSALVRDKNQFLLDLGELGRVLFDKVQEIL